MVGWRREYLDFILVPSGLLLMFGYHLYLLYRYRKYPQTTDIGYENHNKRAWVERMMLVDLKERGPAMTVISCNISAATSLTSISLVLSSIIGAWIGSSTTNIFTSEFVYGSRSRLAIYIKYISLLSCFLAAFACFFQAARYFVHSSFLLSMPNNDVPIKAIQNEVTKGSNFWIGGLRSLYFAGNMLMWVFGPIPMFVCSVIMVVVLFILDKNTVPLHQYQPVEMHHLRELKSNIEHKKTEAIRAIEQLLRADSRN